MPRSPVSAAPERALSQPCLPSALGLRPFQPRSPWLNGDLQTLRDSLRPPQLPPDGGCPLEIPLAGGDRLLAFLDQPLAASQPLALVLLMHGLGGSSDRQGLRRMGLTLQRAGFAVLRLNMRGAGPGRPLARGTYAASCNADLLPALARARALAEQLAPAGLPLFGMGISLGGTMLLNVLQAGLSGAAPLLDGLVCISSPLDLQACSDQIERPRNRAYQRWLLGRLVQQALADPAGPSPAERAALGALRSIRGFDAAITAPRWGYGSVQEYYREASPLPGLLGRLERADHGLPPTLLLHAADDPWVPVGATRRVEQAVQAAGAAALAPLEVLITPRGGHNGFHARCDRPAGAGGCWGDRLTARWLRRLLAGSR